MKTLIAIPCMDMVHTEFLRALMGLEISGEIQYTFAQGSLIYDARNQLAGVAIDGGFDRVLWLDSDMIPAPDMFRRLSEHLDQGKEFVTGLYFTRKSPIRPVIYRDLRMEHEERAFPVPIADWFDDYARDSLFPVKACGFGCVMTTTDLLRRVQQKHGLPFSPVMGWGEDLSFCLRAADVGATLWCDSSIKLGHVGMAVYDEALYRAVSGSNT